MDDWPFLSTVFFAFFYTFHKCCSHRDLSHPDRPGGRSAGQSPNLVPFGTKSPRASLWPPKPSATSYGPQKPRSSLLGRLGRRSVHLTSSQRDSRAQTVPLKTAGCLAGFTKRAGSFWPRTWLLGKAGPGRHQSITTGNGAPTHTRSLCFSNLTFFVPQPCSTYCATTFARLSLRYALLCFAPLSVGLIGYLLLLGRRYNRTKKQHGGLREARAQTVPLKTADSLAQPTFGLRRRARTYISVRILPGIAP